MKLFLSSMHPSNREALVSLCDETDPRTAVIVPTGWDTYPADRRETELRNIQAALMDAGFTTSILDLTTANKESVRSILKDKTLVWVMAGNTFYLNFYLHKSGFAEVIKELIDTGLVYGGESAGAVVAGNTLHGVEKVDDPKEAPEIIWQGLELVKHGVLPHADWEKYRDPIAAAKIEMEKFSRVLTINNDQAIVITDGQEESVDNPSDEDE